MAFNFLFGCYFRIKLSVQIQKTEPFDVVVGSCLERVSILCVMSLDTYSSFTESERMK